MGDTRTRKTSPAIQEKLAIYENGIPIIINRRIIFIRLVGLRSQSLDYYYLSVTALPHAHLEVLCVSGRSAGGGVGLIPALVETTVEMVQEGEGAPGEALIAPRRLPNPCLESTQRCDLHRELLFNQRIGKNVLNQKSELERALSKHKDKQTQNQVREHRETPELERAIAERARRLEQAEQSTEEVEPAINPTLQEIRARLRHAAPPAGAAH